MRYLITCKCLCMCMCTYMYICVCICVFCVIICKGICKNEGVCTGIWYLYVSIYVYTCMSMSMSMSMSMCCTCIYTFSQWATGGKGRLVDRPQFPLIPQRLDMIHQLSPPAEVESKGSRCFGEKKNRFTKRIQFGRQNHPLTALTVDPFGNKVVEMSFFGA